MMTRLWLRCSVAYILLFICVNSYSACSCRNANPDTRKLTELPPLTPKMISESAEIDIPAFRFENVTTNEERVCFAGVSFASNPSLFVRVDAAHVPASPLLDPTDKVQGFHPKQIHF